MLSVVWNEGSPFHYVSRDGIIFMTRCRDRHERDSVLPDVLRMIGNTPLIRLDKIARSEGLKCNLCESLYPLIHAEFHLSFAI